MPTSAMTIISGTVKLASKNRQKKQRSQFLCFLTSGKRGRFDVESGKTPGLLVLVMDREIGKLTNFDNPGTFQGFYRRPHYDSLQYLLRRQDRIFSRSKENGNAPMFKSIPVSIDTVSRTVGRHSQSNT